VTVVSTTATDIYFSHSSGFGNAKLSQLEPALQQRFHFNSEKAAEQEARQRQNHALYVQALMNAPRPQKAIEDATAELVITIDAAAPVVAYEYYNMSRPKPPEIAPGMLGNTHYNFDCHPFIKWHSVPKKNGAGFNWRVEEVNLTLSLPIKITMPQGVTAPLRAHEEGHRQICEHYYALGTEAIHHLCETLREKDFYSPDGEIEKAKARIMSQAAGMILYSYWNYARTPCQQAHQYYDDITDHGRNGIDSKEALARAIARYEPQLSNQPSWSFGTTENTLSAK
jgi:hypothetical protein